MICQLLTNKSLPKNIILSMVDDDNNNNNPAMY